MIAPLRRLAGIAARAYVAGPALEDAMVRARSLAAGGMASTICFWDGPEHEPHQIARQHLETLGAIGRAKLDSYVSLKAPALNFDPALITEIATEARGLDLGLHFDSLGPELADRTFELIENTQAIGTTLGCTLPGRWRRSVADAERAVRLGLNVRVAKGQWAETNGRGNDPRRGCLEVIEALAGRAPKVAVATHDPILAGEAIRKLLASGTPCELELLFGLPTRAVLAVRRKLRVPVRFYIPYGHAWLPYAVRQAAKNPRIFWWMLRDACLGAR